MVHLALTKGSRKVINWFNSADDSVAWLTLEYKNSPNCGHLEVVSNNLKMFFTEAIETVRNNSQNGRLLLLISQFPLIPFGSCERFRTVKDQVI